MKLHHLHIYEFGTGAVSDGITLPVSGRTVRADIIYLTGSAGCQHHGIAAEYRHIAVTVKTYRTAYTHLSAGERLCEEIYDSNLLNDADVAAAYLLHQRRHYLMPRPVARITGAVELLTAEMALCGMSALKAVAVAA